MEVPIHLRPGAGRLLAFTPAPIQTVRVTAVSGELAAGQPLQVKVEIVDAIGTPVPGRFPLEIRVAIPRARSPGSAVMCRRPAATC